MQSMRRLRFTIQGSNQRRGTVSQDNRLEKNGENSIRGSLISISQSRRKSSHRNTITDAQQVSKPVGDGMEIDMSEWEEYELDGTRMDTEEGGEEGALHTCWNATFRTIWEYIQLIILFYNIICIPLRIGMYDHYSTDFTSFSIAWGVVDYVTDILLLIDIFLRARFFIPFEIEQMFQISRIDIWHMYRRGKFTMDMAASIPLDLIAIYTGVEYLPFLRLNKILRLHRASHYVQQT